MKRNNTPTLILTSALILACLLCWTSSASCGDDRILAQVGPYKLTAKQFQGRMDSMPPQLQMAIARRPQLKKQLLDRWVEDNLFALGALDIGLDKDPEFKARLQDIKNGLLASELLRKKLQGKIHVTEQDIESYYRSHKDKYTQPESVRARHILVKVPPGADESAWKDVKAKADRLKKKIDGGADFAELAKKESDDPGSKRKGGDLGFFSRGRMVPEFENVAFSLKPGEVSSPVKTTFGYHIIRVDEKKEARKKSFSEVKNQIRQLLTAQQQQDLKNRLRKDLESKHRVIVHENLLNSGLSPEADQGDKTGAPPAGK